MSGDFLLAVVNENKLRRILTRMLDEERFLSPHGIRSLSKWHNWKWRWSGEVGLPYFRGGIVEHGGAGQPIMEAIHLPAGELHSRLMLDSPMRDGMAVFTMQGEDLPQATNRVDLDPHVKRRVGSAGRPGDVFTTSFTNGLRPIGRRGSRR